jgi:glycogen debranching enzyme
MLTVWTSVAPVASEESRTAIRQMQITILEGATFCICDELGDIVEPTTGFFDADTRFLSRFLLTVNGERPLLLSHGTVEYYSAAWFLRNPLAGGLEQDELSIARRRFVGDGMQDHLVCVNHSDRRLEFELALDFGSDFADIFAVKAFDSALGNPAQAVLPPTVAPTYLPDENEFVFASPPGFDGKTQVLLSEPGEVNGSSVCFRVDLGPRERWQLRVDVIAELNGNGVVPQMAERHFGEELARVRESLAAWQLRVPQLRGTWDDLHHTFNRSVSDLASLRMRGKGTHGQLPAAGMPWFMTVFGRDTLITCLQTLLFGPELAQSALQTLADLQASQDDPSIDAEPGKIVHEVRDGRGAQAWFPAYYGTLDSTPLYLVLLSEVWRWTDDAGLVRALKEPALRALEWIDKYGDLDGDGFVEYRKRSPKGLDNQSWKDSGVSQKFADGRMAVPPIAPVEVQGYVYDAKLRTAELAREVWRDRELAERLEREAAELRVRFDEAFWVDARGGYYALALDADKQPVDSLCSNIGQLLWSGIVPKERADALVDQLMGEELWSGWGVRTMSTADAGFNPLEYHNGTVWPHDNSLIALGLARYERWAEAHRIVRRMMNAAAYFEYQLPEVFAGFARTETPFPVPYPTSCRPQAWAAGTPVLLLQMLLGLEPDRTRHRLVTSAPEVPSWAGSLRLSGVRAFGQAWEVRLDDGHVTVDVT